MIVWYRGHGMIVIFVASRNEYAGKSGADQSIRMDWVGLGLAQASYVVDRNCEEEGSVRLR